MSKLQINPIKIIKYAKNEEEANKIIYAYKTSVKVNKSKEEIKTIIKKFDNRGLQFTEHPNGSIYFRFGIIDPEFGELVIHIDIPQLYLQTKRKNLHFLEKESYRLAILDLKNRIYRLNSSKPRPLLVLLDRVITKQDVPITDLLLQSNSLPSLLPASIESIKKYQEK